MTRSRLFKLALPAVVALGAGTAVAIAAIPSTSDGVIHGCYVDAPRRRQTVGPAARRRRGRHPTQNCATNEATLTWNQQGPAGRRPAGRPRPTRRQRQWHRHGHLGGGGFGSGGASPFDTSQTGGPSADIFLALDGIPGDSDDANHKNEIAIESFAFLAKRPTSPPGSTKLSALRLDKVYDVSSPRLFAAATSGRRIKSAVLTFSTGSDTAGTDVLTYKLSDVTVTSYEQGGANPDAKPLGSLEEEIGLRAARVRSARRARRGRQAAAPKHLGYRGRPSAKVAPALSGYAGTDRTSWQVPQAPTR